MSPKVAHKIAAMGRKLGLRVTVEEREGEYVRLVGHLSSLVQAIAYESGVQAVDEHKDPTAFNADLEFFGEMENWRYVMLPCGSCMIS